MNELSKINLTDPRQDVHKERTHDINLFRYEVAEKLLPRYGCGLKVLELGGGIAELTKRMLSKEFNVTFVDLSEKNIEKAKALEVETYKIDLNEGLVEFANESFDIVIALEVIEHIVSSEYLLYEISRVLKIKGTIILSTPNFNFFLNRLRILFGGLSFDEGYHYRFFNPKSLNKRFSDVGLDVIRTHNTCPAFGINFIFNRLLKKPRKHFRVPGLLSGIFAHTLIYKAVRQ